MNLVVIALEVQELVLHRVLESRVIRITPAHQVNIVVIVVKIVLANVIDLALENRVSLIPTARQVNLVVVLIEHVP